MEQNTNPNSKQQPITQPADNGEPGGGKMFTQEEVNAIVQDRLARDRAKRSPQEPTEEEKRQKELDARESKIACREYVADMGLPSTLLDVLDTSNHEEFKNKVEILSDMLKAAKPAPVAESATIAEMKRRIALEKGIPQELAHRLTGTTETEIYRDAYELNRLIDSIKGPAPMYNPSLYDGSSGAPKGFKSTKHIPKKFPPFSD